MQSKPTNERPACGIAAYFLAGLFALTWKVFRGNMSAAGVFPAWIVKVMPNFLPAAFMLLLVFATSRVLRIRDYLGIALTIGDGLCIYEFARIWMPGRTFDWADIGASVAGTGLASLVGWLVFFVWLPRGEESPQCDAQEDHKNVPTVSSSLGSSGVVTCTHESSKKPWVY
jgi:hypothetical protein